jgi:hypothetical protein
MMIILKHPVAAYVILVTASYAENLPLVGNKSPAELRNNKLVVESNLITGVFVYIIEMDVLGSPLEIVHKFS